MLDQTPAPAAEESPASAPAAAARLPEPEDEDDSIPMPVSLESLLAADAAAAPEAEAVDVAELTDGTSAAGLPSRRRRRDAAEAPTEEPAPDTGMIGLPVRATADQLSALDAEAAPFTPVVSPTEVAPQTPEERSSMFRGFRSRRDSTSEQAPAPAEEATPQPMADALAVPMLEPDAEEMDDVAQVEAPVADAAPETEEPAPVLAEAAGMLAALEAFRRAAGDEQGDADEAASVEPALEDDAASAMEPDAEPAVEDQAEAPALDTDDEPETEVAEAETAEVETAEAGEESSEASASTVFSLPKLATGEVPVSPLARSPYGAAFSGARPVAEPDIESDAEAVVALEAEPTDEAVVEPDVEPTDEAVVEPEAEPEDSSAFVVPMLEEDPDEPVMEEAEAPVDAVPQLEEDEEAEPAEAAAPWADGAAFAMATTLLDEPAPAPAEPEQATDSVETTEPDDAERSFDPAADAGVESVALDDSIYAYQPPQPEPARPEPTMDDIVGQPSGEEAGRAGFFGRLFGRGKHGEPDHEPAPARDTRPPFASPAFEPGHDHLEDIYHPPAPAPDIAPHPAAEPEPEPQAASFTPEPAAESLFEPEPFPEPEPAPARVTPEQLAEPTGWESAGESALAASDKAAPTVYQPVIDTEHSSGRSFADDEADLTRSVFSELNSLSESRPKVDKTKAGLQRRQRPADAPDEVTPIEDEVTLAPKERDAEAVRDRFSSFYSGTQRAREDAAELQLRSTPQPANE